MSTTQDLLPHNLINQLRALERRVTLLERMLGRRTNETETTFYLREKTTGQLYQLECEIVNGEPSLFLAPVGEG